MLQILIGGGDNADIRLDRLMTTHAIEEAVAQNAQKPGLQFHLSLIHISLPKHLSSELVIAAISPEKDVDGFHVVSAGSLLTGRTGFRP